MGVLFEWVSEANRRLDEGEQLGPGRLREMLHALGLEEVLETGEEVPPEAHALMEEREAARTAKDFARADELRDALAAAGYEVRDTSEGPKLRRLP
jgi:cysteinyl-tRNA synthetase